VRVYGVRVVSATLATFARELITEIFPDRDSRYRKRLLRALIEINSDIAA
jgi:uncharacterized protein (DUF58 family)